MKIIQMEPWFGEEEKKSICDYMDEGGWLTEFKRTEIFERMIADYTGAKHCIVVNNGTISLTLAALACNLKQGDEVIVPNYTMIATPNSVKIFGATPVFVDVEQETLCLDIELVKKAISKRTKAIILVTANGRYPRCGVDAFLKLVNEYNLILIEDAAQSLGSFYPNGNHMGTMGHVGSFSFSAPKVISTGQGGALVTNDDNIANEIRCLKDFGRSGGGNDIHGSIGYNFKFTEMQACIGIEQMKKLAWRVERKKKILELYKSELCKINQVKFFDQDLVNTTPWFIDVEVEGRDGLAEYLSENGIGTRVMYSPINEQQAYQIEGIYPVSKSIGLKGLWLPSSSQLKDDEIAFITTTIKEYYNKRS